MKQKSWKKKKKGKLVQMARKNHWCNLDGKSRGSGSYLNEFK